MGPEDLKKILNNLPKAADQRIIIGYETGDDAAVIQVRDDLLLVQSLDFFMPIVDDPFVFGQIAAANAISDIYAMGATPIVALAILGFPIKKLSTQIAKKIMEGGVDICNKAGIVIAGGHSIDDNEPKFGLSVTGSVSPQNLWHNSTAKAGDVLVLTKPLGVGALGQGNKKGVLTKSQYERFVKTTTFLNKAAKDAGAHIGVNACTDITGFGLIGHTLEMAKGSKSHIRLYMNALPVLDGVWDLLRKNIKPGATSRNLEFSAKDVTYGNGISEIDKFLCADPQTSGGLLFSIPKEKVSDLVESCKYQGTLCATVIGEVLEQKEGMSWVSVVKTLVK